jgi:hypothetical protein
VNTSGGRKIIDEPEEERVLIRTAEALRAQSKRVFLINEYSDLGELRVSAVNSLHSKSGAEE